MRKLALSEKWACAGAKFGEIAGAECVENFGDAAAELRAIRQTAALCDLSFSKIFSYGENEGIDFLDTVLAANILKLRYGGIIDTFLADENGGVLAETFVGNIDDRVLVVAETEAESLPLAVSPECDITENCVLLSVDGPLAWKVARGVFGSDVLNLSFLSLEKYDFEGAGVILMRSGQTGEFGYRFVVPNAVAEPFCAKLEEQLAAVGGRLCGFDAHRIARMQGNFFDIYEEGAVVRNPLVLGLQYMVDFEKESFAGSEAIFANRAAGVSERLVGVKFSAENVSDIYDGSRKVGRVVARRGDIGLAVFDAEYACAGFAYSAAPDAHETVFTTSRPFVLADSLSRGMED